MRRGNALILALTTIAVLSILVIAFVYEARQQSGLNIYVRERNRVTRLVDAGRILGEVVLLNYTSVSEWTRDQDDEQMMEEDRWFREKQDLKSYGKCTIGPILLDEEDEGSGTVTIDIQSVNSGEKGVININELYKNGGDGKYVERWWMIFLSHNIPEELSTPKDGTINLWNILIASWDDWRDDDDTVSSIDGEECGAENQWYEEFERDNKIDDEDKRRPRNGPIPDIKELSYVRGFREYPQVLTGGVINPWETRKEDQITVRGIESLFCTEGSSKININSCQSVDALITVPGVYQDPEDGEKSLSEAMNVAQMILGGLTVMPEDRDVDETREWWPYKDWNDLTERVDEDIGNEASSYFDFGASANTVFKMKITGESMGMTHEVQAECYVRDKKIRYIKWRED
ncbi:MAG: hypothetical protein IJI73_02775 [Kiritimatiellae bacterium]|nr:hypothetical protein [Kiritimatiellia bacterium]